MTNREQRVKWCSQMYTRVVGYVSNKWAPGYPTNIISHHRGAGFQVWDGESAMQSAKEAHPLMC